MIVKCVPPCAGKSFLLSSIFPPNPEVVQQSKGGENDENYAYIGVTVCSLFVGESR